MSRPNLNNRYNFSIRSTYRFTAGEQRAVSSFVPLVLKNWESQKAGIKALKLNLRKHLEREQRERCAYCRQYLQSSGKGEHLDHIVAKDIRPQWMFVSKNLVLSCGGCNTSKKDKPVLNPPYDQENVNYPAIDGAFKIFNPYFEKWSDHFLIDDEIFIQAKAGTKGDFTIQACKLSREQVIINNTRELNLSKTKSKKKITQRLYITPTGTDEYLAIQNALEQIKRTI